MASLKYFLLSSFLFLCLSYTFADGVFNYDDGFGFDSMSSPTPDLSAGGINNVGVGSGTGLKAGPGVKGEMSNVGAGSRAEPKASAGPKLGVSGFGVGVGVGVGYGSEDLPPGFGGPRMGRRPGPGGYRPSPIIDEPYGGCMLGYVCPKNGPWACSKFEYGLCDSYNFHPLSASTDLHEVKINWAKSKPVATAQHGGSGPVINIDSAH